jgi:hypothetical protein
MARRSGDVEKAETCCVRRKVDGRALRMLLVLWQRETVDVADARARARGAERAMVRRDIIVADLWLWQSKAGKKGEYASIGRR